MWFSAPGSASSGSGCRCLLAYPSVDPFLREFARRGFSFPRCIYPPKGHTSHSLCCTLLAREGAPHIHKGGRLSRAPIAPSIVRVLVRERIASAPSKHCRCRVTPFKISSAASWPKGTSTSNVTESDVEQPVTLSIHCRCGSMKAFIAATDGAKRISEEQIISSLLALSGSVIRNGYVRSGHFVPKTDADGNDIAGVRLPEVQVPLGTYTGWALRAAPSE